MATDDKHPDSVTFHEDTSKADMEGGVLAADIPELLRILTPEELKKVGRRAVFKEEIIMMPCLMIMYILNYLDRNNISVAKLAPLHIFLTRLCQDDDREEITPFKGLQMAVRDPKTWLLLSVMYATFTSAGVTNFVSSVVNSFGFSRTITYVLTALPFLLCCVCMLANGFHSDRTGERFLHIVLPLVITLIANILAISTLNIGARYTAMMLIPASYYSSSNVHSPDDPNVAKEKK
ncbi:hypothetical protein Sste5346_006309 [Sporothrix stenoceras]|uniref:Uncharacterized protein n=1 Tax=Sporothrix stenoceras TaxID=5173 RepID=A0ABR3YYL3_9PEZI